MLGFIIFVAPQKSKQSSQPKTLLKSEDSLPAQIILCFLTAKKALLTP